MNYKLLDGKGDSSRVLLQLSGTTKIILMAAFLLLGLPLGIAGALTVAQGNPLSLGLLGFGLAFTSAALILATSRHSPHRIVFDNQAGQMILQEKGRSFHLPYAEIRDLSVQRHVSTSTSSSGTSRSVRWEVSLNKRDGARWTLMTFQNKKRAEQMLQELQGRVDLTGGKQASSEPARSGTFQVSDDLACDAIVWKKPLSLGRSALFLVIILSFGLIGLGMLEGSFALYPVLAFVCLLALAMVVTVVASVGQVHRIEVSDRELRSRTQGGIWGKRGFTIPIEEVGAITFNFSPQAEEALIFVLRREEVQRLAQLRQSKGEISDFLSVVGLLWQANKIAVGELTTGQKVELEGLIQSSLRRRCPSWREVEVETM